MRCLINLSSLEKLISQFLQSVGLAAELLEENSKNNVSNIYTQEIKKDSDSPNRIPPRPQTNEFKIPPRARDGKTFSTDLTQKEMLEKIIKQNQKIINQNKIIIEELKKVNK